jgi:hypothetical protein
MELRRALFKSQSQSRNQLALQEPDFRIGSVEIRGTQVMVDKVEVLNQEIQRLQAENI